MRLVPVVLRYSSNFEDAVYFAAESSRLTHGAQEAVDACRFFAALLWGALAGVPKAVLLSDRSRPFFRIGIAIRWLQRSSGLREDPTRISRVPTLKTVLARFPSVKRLVLVADRGLLSLDNLEALDELRRASGRALEFILAVPGRRYQEFAELLDEFHRTQCQPATAEVIGEMKWNALRLIIAHDPERAALQTQRRDDQINALIRQGEQWVGKLDEQDEGVRRRGRKLSDSGAKARFFHAVSEVICRRSSRSI